MDPAPAIGIGAGFAVVIAANVMEGGNPMSLLLIRPDPARLRHHPAGHRGRRHHEGRQDGRRVDQARLHRQRGVRRGPDPSRRRPGRAGPSRGPAGPGGRRQGSRRRLPAPRRHDGHRRHRPRGAARDPRVRGLRQAARGQAGREVLRRRRRLRADHRHHRHRHGPRARAREPGRSRGARAPDRRRVRRHPVGRHVRQRDLPAARQPAQAARRARGRAHGGHHRGHRRHPGRLQPAGRRPEAAGSLLAGGGREEAA